MIPKQMLWFAELLLVSCFVIFFFVYAGALQEEPSFFGVPLSCPAAKSIGCGSHSKPVLLALEKNPHIKEAWMDRTGTIIAVVWRAEKNANDVEKVFSKFGLQVNELKNEEYVRANKNFHDRKNWYRGADVDALSAEEAKYLADNLLSSMQSHVALKDHVLETKMREEFRNAFRIYLLKRNAYEKPNPFEIASLQKELFLIGEKYLGKGKMPEVEIRIPDDHQ